ncbi:MAG: histidinol dehydrogenase [Phycisphaerales bacterium]|jgi:histidinol dehydrogenase
MTIQNSTLLRRVTPEQVQRSGEGPVDRETLAKTQELIDEILGAGEMGRTSAARAMAERFGDLNPSEPMLCEPDAMKRALESIDPEDRSALERAADRIRRFAKAQRAAIGEVTVDIPGGQAGHTIEPVSSAGCYAPGGRYPLPSSVLMTAITARAAGCERVVVASPNSNPIMLAAASIAGCDSFLSIGGVQAITALTYGIDGCAPVDVIAGPGNRWVTAAKQLLVGEVGIDMLAGPSELMILADETADARLIAADLLAQAEHDTDASAMLVTTCGELIERVEIELRAQLKALPTRSVASVSLGNGFACLVDDLEHAVIVADRVAPEHLEIMTVNASAVAQQVHNAGAVFVGDRSAEVFGDYGAGPNHTLPTGGTARSQAGLSVMSFLRLRTWIRIDDSIQASAMKDDTARLARLEGLAGHERSTLMR